MDDLYQPHPIARSIMRGLFYTCIPLAIIFVSIAGCHVLESIYLKSPTKVPPQELQEFKSLTIPNEFMAGSVKDMMQRIEIRFEGNDTRKDISPILHDCLSFLVCEFGPPVYRGRVVLVITDDPSDNAFILWKENDDLERKITLNHYNIMKPIWHHYLVHELFHGFYQSTEFLRINPDAIIEGLAVYAQYKYQNQEMSNDQIRDKVYEDAVALRPYSGEEGIDFDRPFESYGDAQKKYIYLVCGLLFFDQYPQSVKEKIEKLLWFPPSSDKKMPFEGIVALYDLTLDDEIFHQGNTKALALPRPKKYTADPYDNHNLEGDGIPIMGFYLHDVY